MQKTLLVFAALLLGASRIYTQTVVIPDSKRPAGFPPELVQIQRWQSQAAMKGILSKLVVLKDSELDNYLNGLSKKMKPFLPIEDRSLEFPVTVVRDKKYGIRGFTGGGIVLDIQNLCSLGSEDLLVFAIAHEVTHVVKLHELIDQQLGAYQELNFPKPDDLLKKQLAQQINDQQYMEEIEADIGAVHLMLRAGYVVANRNEFLTQFNDTDVHMDPVSRTKAVMDETALYRKNFKVSATSHPRPTWVARKCYENGYLPLLVPTS